MVSMLAYQSARLPKEEAERMEAAARSSEEIVEQSARLMPAPQVAGAVETESVAMAPKEFKTIEIARTHVHDESGLSFWVETPVEPNESIRAYFRHEDGRVEEAISGYSVTPDENGRRNHVSGLWTFHGEFADGCVKDAGRQLEAFAKRGPFEVPVNERFHVFTVTNSTGRILHGDVEFVREEPEGPAANLVAHLQVTGGSVSGFDSVMIHFNPETPRGHRLRAVCDGPAGFSSEANLRGTEFSRGPSGFATWRWPKAWTEVRSGCAERTLEGAVGGEGAHPNPVRKADRIVLGDQCEREGVQREGGVDRAGADSAAADRGRSGFGRENACGCGQEREVGRLDRENGGEWRS
jgi:hypothetical protein